MGGKKQNKKHFENKTKIPASKVKTNQTTTNKTKQNTIARE